MALAEGDCALFLVLILVFVLGLPISFEHEEENEDKNEPASWLKNAPFPPTRPVNLQPATCNLQLECGSAA
jgi:hypothetical protein